MSNVYVPHLLRLLDNICDSKRLRKPFANEILINPYTYGKDEDIIQLCQEKDILLMAYSAVAFNYVRMLLAGDEKLRSNKENFNMTSAHVILSF